MQQFLKSKQAKGGKKGKAASAEESKKAVIFVAKEFPDSYKKIIEILRQFDFNEAGEI